jgi:hypothetical protein
MRRENLNAAERIQREEIRVASDDVCSLATHCQLEELVVLWISAGCYLHININPLRLARQSCKKGSNILLIHIAAKPLSAQDFIQFGEHRERNQDSSFLESRIKRLARLRIGKEQGAD